MVICGSCCQKWELFRYFRRLAFQIIQNDVWLGTNTYTKRCKTGKIGMYGNTIEVIAITEICYLIISAYFV
jgi:hypothetical protein